MRFLGCDFTLVFFSGLRVFLLDQSLSISFFEHGSSSVLGLDLGPFFVPWGFRYYYYFPGRAYSTAFTTMMRMIRMIMTDYDDVLARILVFSFLLQLYSTGESWSWDRCGLQSWRVGELILLGDAGRILGAHTVLYVVNITSINQSSK